MIFKGSNFEQAQKIKENFGIGRNDSWEVMPYNLLVEGQEDKGLIYNINEKIPPSSSKYSSRRWSR